MTQVARSLKGDGLGGVSLVSDARAGEDAADGARRIAGRSGLDVLIDRLGPAADRGLALRLLGDVLLVEGWATAWEIVERNPEVRAVTPEGDVIAAGRVRLAEADGAGPAALEAAMVALERADREQARSASNSTTARREFDGARDRERRLLEELENLEARLAGHAEAVGMIERSSAEGASEVARLEERRRALGETAAAREERIAELRSRVGEFEGEERTHQMAWEALTRRRDEVAARRDDARRLAHEATAAAAAAAEHLRLLEVRLDATRHELAGVESAPVDVASIARLEVIESTAKAATDIVRRHVAELRIRQRDLRTEAGEAGVRLDAAQRRRSELEGAVTVARERMSTLAVELAELRVRDESVLEALRRDADADESEALAAARPEIDDGAEPRDLLATREAELRRMGPVNPLAAAEYKELAAEVAHLDAQLADLEASRKELLKVISALDDEMATLFRGAYEEIARLFEENFALVFPGGRGTIRLTEPDKPLQTGVEIEAQPLGKKVSRLSLLSGGERSLAALAFLFAVFRARPSPFYVLDEVEAALDDANLRRFLRLVGTLRESAQLVIITHQQQTMEAADILYGVTMEPGESSQVVTKRLDIAVAR
jgi:chromosome segregation protein